MACISCTLTQSEVYIDRGRPKALGPSDPIDGSRPKSAARRCASVRRFLAAGSWQLAEQAIVPVRIAQDHTTLPLTERLLEGFSGNAQANLVEDLHQIQAPGPNARLLPPLNATTWRHLVAVCLHALLTGL